jgi:hypothetical protein
MKTYADESCRQEIRRRLNTIRPDSERRWGRMSAAQMICHLADACRMALGDKAVSPASGPLRQTVVKWTALYLPLPWPPGVLTRPEIDQQRSGTAPGDFAADVQQVVVLLERIASRDRRGLWPAHPIFGRMSARAWLRWTYLHADHHLRQFGA